ncbi:MAG: sugar-binding domain-containing protein, partial [Bacteroidota bacterium]
MQKKITVFYLLLCVSFLNTAFSQTKINFNEGWKFHLGNAANPEKDFNYSIATIFAKSGAAVLTAIDTRFKDSTWRTVNLPHDWAVELPFVKSSNTDVEAHGFKPVGGLFPETSIGWYRKKFKVAAADSGQRFQIQFDGIFRNANIWVNGFFVGNNMSGYTGAAYDITDVINFHSDNVIVVRVDATQYEGWFYEGAGIYRNVWLRKINNQHIAQGSLYAYADVKGNDATINIEAAVENSNITSSNCTVYTYIATRDGKIIAQSKEQPLSLAVNGKATVKQKLLVPNAHLWNLDDPYLYRVGAV